MNAEQSRIIEQQQRTIRNQQRQLSELESFRQSVLALLQQAKDDPQPMSKLTGGMLSEVLNEGAPITITRYRNADAYLLPSDAVRTLMED
jgi:hypothetical protein